MMASQDTGERPSPTDSEQARWSMRRKSNRGSQRKEKEKGSNTSLGAILNPFKKKRKDLPAGGSCESLSEPELVRAATFSSGLSPSSAFSPSPIKGGPHANEYAQLDDLSRPEPHLSPPADRASMRRLSPSPRPGDSRFITTSDSEVLEPLPIGFSKRINVSGRAL